MNTRKCPALNRLTILSVLATSSLVSVSHAQADSILVQSTTSTANSGLYDHLLPLFKDATGVDVNVVAVGTGQAIRNASNCDADVLLVHAKAAEEKFVSDGHGLDRFDLMYNDFVIVGPKADPAGIRGGKDITVALLKVARSESLFASRGDDSGTHKKERSLWQATDIDPTGSSGKWYRETGSGMGATLNVGVGMQAYVMTDRATWINFKNKSDFDIVVEGDEDLFNQYGVLLVNPAHCKNVKHVEGQQFIDWLVGDEGQAAIADYSVDGQQLFFPNATTSE